jgi:hypothetical protein
MQFDVKTIRVLGRITDRMDLIRKNPHRYEIDADTLAEVSSAAQKLDELLTKVRTIKAG